MELQRTGDVQTESLVKEIKYYMGLSAIQKLLVRGLITEEIYHRSNVALAEMYGVFRYRI